MNKIHVALLFFLAFVNAAYSQSKTDLEEKPYIEVTGTSEKLVVPDEIYVKIVIREKYVGKEKITIESQEGKLKAGLNEIGIDLQNLSLADANADYVRVKLWSKDVLTRNEYLLKVSTATILGKVFQKLDQLEITDAFIIRVEYSKIDSLKKEVKILAIKAAKEKADYLLQAIGEQAGKPLIIQESNVSSINSSTGNVRSSRSESISYYVDGNKSKDKEPELEFQKIKVASSIYVKFQIK